VGEVFSILYPDMVYRLIMVDGGLTAHPAADVDIEALMKSQLGPMLERLSLVFKSVDEYIQMMHGQPALKQWNKYFELYARYDVEQVENGFKPRPNIEAVKTDYADMVLNSLLRTKIGSIKVPLTLIRAGRNVMDESNPIIDDVLVAEYRKVLPQLEDRMLVNFNHYTIVMSEEGARYISKILENIDLSRMPLWGPI